LSISIIEGDCIEKMKDIQSGSVDLVLTDLPYGTTYAPWDIIIPMDDLWDAWLRVLKPKGAMVLTASQPFTSMLVISRPKLFRCEWIWDKVNGANFANCNKQPFKVHENILVFSEGQSTYNPQKTVGTPYNNKGQILNDRNCETQKIKKRLEYNNEGTRYPKSIQIFPKHSSQLKLHSTQKPVELFEYLIRTYSNEGETVLDCCAGSGTTGEAARRCNRNAILIDSDPKFIEIMKDRLFCLEDIFS
jgi:site-specific DNA-methyltransferase (adenine-specific)